MFGRGEVFVGLIPGREGEELLKNNSGVAHDHWAQQLDDSTIGHGSKSQPFHHAVQCLLF